MLYILKIPEGVKVMGEVKEAGERAVAGEGAGGAEEQRDSEGDTRRRGREVGGGDTKRTEGRTTVST